jgi:hypothetical protein
MNRGRRIFMATAGAGAAALTAPASSAFAASRSKALIHHAFFWLKNPGSAADRDRLVAGLETLRAIGVIRSLHIGLPAATERRDVVDASYDVSEMMMFDSVEDQKTYQDHPIHQAFVANYSDLWAKVVVYDAMDVG